MTTRGDRSNEIRQFKRSEATSPTSTVGAEAGYSGYITSATSPADLRSNNNNNNRSCCLPPSSSPTFLPACPAESQSPSRQQRFVLSFNMRAKACKYFVDPLQPRLSITQVVFSNHIDERGQPHHWLKSLACF